MGIFNFRQKEQAASNTQQNAPNEYNPWDPSHGYSTTDYSTAVFLSLLSRSPREIGPNADTYPRYVSYELGIHDPIRKHQELLQNGFLRVATQLEILETLKVSDLKNLLGLYGFQAKGKKADLIKAITESIAPVALKLPQMYCVSEKGLEYMRQNEDYINLHGNPYSISYAEFIEVKKQLTPQFKYNDIVWFIFNQRELHFPPDAYGLKRNNELYRAQFLKSEGKLTDALYRFIVVLYYDIHFPDFDEIIPYIKEQIQSLKEYYSDTMIEKCYRTYSLPNRIPMDAFKHVLNGIFQEE